jgi:hypothetical protein
VIVVDGTWSQARKVLKQNPFLLALPRIGLTPERPSNYRIRAEPSAECVSTIEAVVHLLGALEGAPERFRPILTAFDRMVDLQIAERDRRSGPPRRIERRGPRAPRVDVAVAALRARPADVVAVYAEANGWAAGSGPGGADELIQLTAERVATGERYEAVVAPRRPLGPSVALHLELPEARLLAGEPVAEALARFEAFLRPADLLCGWGPYALGLLRAEGAPGRDFADLRLACARVLKRRPGGVEQAVRLLGQAALPRPAGQGRAGRRAGGAAPGTRPRGQPKLTRRPRPSSGAAPPPRPSPRRAGGGTGAPRRWRSPSRPAAGPRPWRWRGRRPAARGGPPR